MSLHSECHTQTAVHLLALCDKCFLLGEMSKRKMSICTIYKISKIGNLFISPSLFFYYTSKEKSVAQFLYFNHP